MSCFCFFRMYLKFYRSDSGLSWSINSLISFCSDNSVKFKRYSQSFSSPSIVLIALEKIPTARIAESN